MTKIIVLILFLLGEAYGIFLNAVRYRSAKNPIPENVRDVYDEETYAKWRSYAAEHTSLSIISSAVSAVILLLSFIFNLHAAFASLFSSDKYAATFAVVLFALIITTVTDLVTSYVRTMIIEEKYGFNKSTLKTFIFDSIRQTLINFALSMAVSYLVLFLHEWAGDFIILIFAAVFFTFTMLISFLYPVLSRVGNKFVPLPDGELREKLMALLSKYGYKVKEIEVIDASRRTTKTDAYFTGFGKLKTIVLYDNLVNSMTTDEICAVFAHEMGHGLHRDVLKSQILGLLHTLLIGVIVFVTLKIPTLYTDFGFEEINYGFSFVLIGICLNVLSPIVSFVSNAVSRAHEYRADRQAVKEGYGEALVSSLKKLSRDNFAHLAPSKINVVLEYDHPPMSERIAAIEDTVE